MVVFRRAVIGRVPPSYVAGEPGAGRFGGGRQEKKKSVQLSTKDRSERSS